MQKEIAKPLTLLFSKYSSTQIELILFYKLITFGRNVVSRAAIIKMANKSIQSAAAITI